jgi:hypothetical protein
MYGPYEQKIPFSDLQAMNITARQLLVQSAPMSVAESYQIFLDNGLYKEGFFLRCELPWFGPNCQYAFVQSGRKNSFESVVKSKFTDWENIFTRGEYHACHQLSIKLVCMNDSSQISYTLCFKDATTEKL